MNNKSENDFVQAYIKDEFLYVIYKKEAIIGLEAAKQIVELRMSVSAGKDYNLICYFNNIKAVTNEAKEYFASKEACKEIKKAAFIVNSVFIKYLGNAFIVFNKPAVPVRIFNNEDDAKQWLREGK